MQGSAAEDHVVVSFFAGGQRHLTVDDGQFLTSSARRAFFSASRFWACAFWALVV